MQEGWYISVHGWGLTIDIERKKIDCLRFVMCLLLAPGFQGFFFLFLMWPLTVLMKQTRQAVCAIKQSIYLDVYGPNHAGAVFTTLHFLRDL